MSNPYAKTVQVRLPKHILNAAARWTEFELFTSSDVVALVVVGSFGEKSRYRLYANLHERLENVRAQADLQRFPISLQLPLFEHDCLHAMARGFGLSVSDMLIVILGDGVAEHASEFAMECCHVRLPVALVRDAEWMGSLNGWTMVNALFHRGYPVEQDDLAQELDRVRAHSGPEVGLDLQIWSSELQRLVALMARYEATLDEVIVASTWRAVRRDLLISLYRDEHSLSHSDAATAVLLEKKRPTGFTNSDPNL